MRQRKKIKVEQTMEQSAVFMGPLLQTALLSFIKYSCPALSAIVGLDEVAFLDKL